MTFEQLKQKWQQDGVTDGNVLQRSSFNRHRDAILDMFGIIIECEPRTYKYYISNAEVLNDDSIERWLFSTLTVHGVLADSTDMAHIVVRAYGMTPHYLRTLPLHQSQQELCTTEEFADFSFDIRPTADFLGRLLSYGSDIEVLQPQELREKMKGMIAESLKRY